ncbi:MAG: hypothetical protein JKY27_08315 [Magnetovibrio sp.]|nr:hypothetical protein [Magnetovibrio sp.]
MATSNKKTIIKPHVQENLQKLSNALRDNLAFEPYINQFINDLQELPPSSIKQASREIRASAQLHFNWDKHKVPWAVRLANGFSGPATVSVLTRPYLSLLSQHPKLCFLFLFHSDGYYREAALKHWNETDICPFVFSALSQCLNDWVEQVRHAAYNCARHIFPLVPAKTVSISAFDLHQRFNKFQRWSTQERKILEQTLFREDVIVAFVSRLMQPHVGKASKVFRNSLMQAGIDKHLHQIAQDAENPFLRAIAYETLLSKQARWKVGHAYQWIDKVYGLKKRIAVFKFRNIDHDLSIDALLIQGSTDRSIVVKKVIASQLIKMRNEASATMRKISHELAKDKSESVRKKAHFFLDNSKIN